MNALKANQNELYKMLKPLSAQERVEVLKRILTAVEQINRDESLAGIGGRNPIRLDLN